MNILMLGRWLPLSRRAGPGTREYHFARHLARSHRLTLAFTTDDPSDGHGISTLRDEFGDVEFAVVGRGWKYLSGAISLATGESCTLDYFRSGALSARLADRVRTSRYDLVYVSSSSMIQYALEVDPAIPMVIDFGDIDSEWWRRQARARSFPAANFYGTEAARLRVAEAAAAHRARSCVVASPQAAHVVGSFAPRATITVIPSGVASDWRAPVPRPSWSPTVAFLSPIESDRDAAEAADFCRAAVPAVRAHVAAARFMIPGPVRWAISRLTEIDGVEIGVSMTEGWLFLNRVAVAIAPLQSIDGATASVLAAMGAAVPVITTSRARAELGARADREIKVEDAPHGFARAVVELLQRPSLGAEIGTRAAAFIRAQYSWENVVARLTPVLEAVVPARQPVREEQPGSASPSHAPGPVAHVERAGSMP